VKIRRLASVHLERDANRGVLETFSPGWESIAAAIKFSVARRPSWSREC
jgi:hypothetical protein